MRQMRSANECLRNTTDGPLRRGRYPPALPLSPPDDKTRGD
jgi:hypothetical protein